MENIFDPAYRQDYLLGYSDGLNPFQLLVKKSKNNKAFKHGFDFGRLEFERLNGKLTDGIPRIIVTEKVLEDFLMAGMLGISIDSEGFTPYQISIIQQWYESGVEKYEPNESIYLLALLEKNGIETY